MTAYRGYAKSWDGVLMVNECCLATGLSLVPPRGSVLLCTNLESLTHILPRGQPQRTIAIREDQAIPVTASKYEVSAMQFEGGAVISVQYKDREVKLNTAHHGDMGTASLAMELQAALNLSAPPVGLRLRVAPGAEAVVCPLSVLIACPSYIASTFQGMSWFPLLDGAPDEDEETHNAAEATTTSSKLPRGPPTEDPIFPPPLGSPLGHDLSFLATNGSTASPSEGCGRPLTAPPGDRTRGGTSRQRPGRREGLGRPASATPSDKSSGMRRFRPGKREGFGRPVTALPSDHSGSGSPGWGSPHGFRCEEESARPATAPALRRQSSSNLSGSSQQGCGIFGERFGRGGDIEVDAFGEAGGRGVEATHLRNPSRGDGGQETGGKGGTREWGGVGSARECWV